MYARMLFGASALLLGVIMFTWHDADTWQQLIVIWTWPFGAAVAELLAAAQIAGGIGLLFERTAHRASIVLIVVYAIFSLASVPEIIAAPKVYQGYGSFFEQFTPLCGAIAVYGGLNGFARIGLGFCAASFALEQLVYLRQTAAFVPKWIPPSQMFWAVLTTIAFALAAIAILTNVRARLAIRLMTLMLAIFGVAVWIPMLATHPEAHGNWSEFALTFLIAGAAWTVGETAAGTR